MKLRGILLIIPACLVACSSVPKDPEKPDGSQRTIVNNPRIVAEEMTIYYREQEEKRRAVVVAPRTVNRLAVSEILEKYVPSDMHVYVDDGVDLSTIVEYEISRPWFEALGKPLGDAGIEMTANLSRKVMRLRAGKLTLGKVITVAVPAEYTVYADSGVSMDASVKFDRSVPWFQGLGVACGEIGVLLTVNVDRHLVLLKTKNRRAEIVEKGQVLGQGNAMQPVRRAGSDY